MNRHEVLLRQVEAFREETLHLIEGITEEQADIVPQGFSNNIRWNLGHLYVDQYLWIMALTKEPIDFPQGFREWFDYGTSPAGWKGELPSLKELKALLAEQPKHIRDVYADRLDETFPPTELGMNTIADVLVRTIFHEGLHLAAIQSIRRFL
ncbi:MAG: DinB family protein [Clostridia bacterium]